MRLAKARSEESLFDVYIDDNTEYRIEICPMGNKHILKVTRLKETLLEIPPSKIRYFINYLVPGKTKVIKVMADDLLSQEENLYLICPNLDFINEDPEIVDLFFK